MRRWNTFFANYSGRCCAMVCCVQVLTGAFHVPGMEESSIDHDNYKSSSQQPPFPKVPWPVPWPVPYGRFPAALAGWALSQDGCHDTRNGTGLAGHGKKYWIYRPLGPLGSAKKARRKRIERQWRSKYPAGWNSSSQETTKSYKHFNCTLSYIIIDFG